MENYFLPRHVYFCRRGQAYIFLDLERDEYKLINGRAAQALRDITTATTMDGYSADRHRELDSMATCGLLTADTYGSRPLAPTSVQLALEPLVDPDLQLHTRISFAHVRTFLRTCAIAAMLLRFRRIKYVVERVERRKRRQPCSMNIGYARELTAIFLALRKLFPRRYLCLYDSVALLEFLAHFHVYPTWVFGVKLEPWAAHCWIQHEGFSFNEDIEEAANYTPIMAI
jgi:hypothetical protein